VKALITQQIFEFACDAHRPVALLPDGTRHAKPRGAGRIIRLIVGVWNDEHGAAGA
jgi:hypothetical protein